MRKLCLCLLLFLLPLSSQATRMHPFFTSATNSNIQFWLNKTNFNNLYDAGYERYQCSYWYGHFIEAAVNPYPYEPTNFWVYNFTYRYGPSGSSTYNYPELEEDIYSLVPEYLMFTNRLALSNTFNHVPDTYMSNWTYKTMYEFLHDEFTNTDGNVGVGIYASPDVTETNWYWTLTWQTQRWEICLGELTFSITNRIITNGITYYYCGWVYQDQDRIVKKPRGTWYGPPEWCCVPTPAGLFNTSNWWVNLIKDDAISWHKIGQMFDYVDMTGISNKLTFTSGNPSVWTNLPNSITLNILGHTNYDGDYNTGGWFRRVNSWIRESYIVSGKTNNETLNVTQPYFDAGGYSNEVRYWGAGGVQSYATNWFDGLTITNQIVYSNNFPITNHIGDKIKLTMSSMHRLYKLPRDSVNGNYKTISSLASYVDNRSLNELVAVMQLQRVIKDHETGYFQTTWEIGHNHWPSSDGFWSETGSRATNVYPYSIDDWEGGKAWCAADFWKNTTAANGIYSGRATFGKKLNDTLFNAEAWAAEMVFYYGVGAPRYTNITARIDFYMSPRIPTIHFWFEGNQNISPPTFTNFDDQGDDVLENKWTYWGSTNYIKNYLGELYSPHIGGNSNSVPDWCRIPTYSATLGATNSVLGWELKKFQALWYWDMRYFTNAFW